ncbi:hypothetical protein [Nocardia sp. NPDC058497]
MGSTDVINWLVEGYHAGDPVRGPIWIAFMYAMMPFQLLAMMTGSG